MLTKQPRQRNYLVAALSSIFNDCWWLALSYAETKGNGRFTNWSNYENQVPTVYVRLLQGYDLMDVDHQKSCSMAASKLRLMVILSKTNKSPFCCEICESSTDSPRNVWEFFLIVFPDHVRWCLSDVRIISTAWTSDGEVGTCDGPSSTWKIWDDRGLEHLLWFFC